MTVSRVPVPGTTTVCSSRASKTWSISRVAMRGALGRMRLDEASAACFPQSCGGAVAFQQPGDGLVVEAWPEYAFQAGVELGEQAAYPVGGAGGLGGEVLVEAGEHGQFGGDLVGQFQGAQGVRHGAGRVCDHRGVLRVCLGLARVEVGDAAHGQAGQVGDLAARVAGDGQGRAPMEAGWSTITSTVPNFAASLSKTARSLGSLFGSGLSKTFFPAGVSP